MKRAAFVGLLLGAAAMHAAPAAAQHWNIEVEKTAQGHRVGNPEAPLQLVEFISYTCPTCARFEVESEAQLRYFYVHEGYASVEVRYHPRNVADVAAALVAECGPDENFFGNHRVLLVEQHNWLPRMQSLTQGQYARWMQGRISERMRAIASDLGWYELMEPRGYSRVDLDRCLSDEARAVAIDGASERNASEFGINSTPSLVLNGNLLPNVYSWPQLSLIFASMRESAPEDFE